MLNADSDPVKRFFKLVALKSNFNIKNYYRLQSKVMPKNWIWLLDYYRYNTIVSLFACL